MDGVLKRSVEVDGLPPIGRLVVLEVNGRECLAWCASNGVWMDALVNHEIKEPVSVYYPMDSARRSK